jgi:hypothetical protein
MCVQLDLEVICKKPKKEGRLSNFEEFHPQKRPSKKKALMFECYDLVDSMEKGAIIF